MLRPSLPILPLGQGGFLDVGPPWAEAVCTSAIASHVREQRAEAIAPLLLLVPGERWSDTDERIAITRDRHSCRQPPRVPRLRRLDGELDWGTLASTGLVPAKYGLSNLRSSQPIGGAILRELRNAAHRRVRVSELRRLEPRRPEVLQRLRPGADCGSGRGCPGDRRTRRSARPSLPRARAPRREDPRRPGCPRGGAQAGNGAVRRRDGLDGACRGKRP